MLLARKLIGYLYSAFNRDPKPFLALRFRYAGTGMKWRVQDGILAAFVTDGPGDSFQVALDGMTLGGLAAFIAGHTGYSVVYSDASGTESLSAMVLLDDDGDQNVSNGDHLYAYTSFTRAYMEANAIELQEARGQIKSLPDQMNVLSADTIWLDELGDYYKVPRGTVIKPGYENLFTWAEVASDASWSKVRSSITANVMKAPDGTITGDFLVEDGTASNTHDYRKTISKAATPITYTASRIVKAGTRTKCFMWMHGASQTNRVEAWYDLVAGVVGNIATQGSGFSAPSATIRPMGDGWYRLTLTGTSDTSTTIGVLFGIATAMGIQAYSGDGHSGLYVWGAQLNTGGIVSDYLQTRGSAITNVPVDEPDNLYGPRIIQEILRPKLNNKALELAISAFAGGLDAQIVDVVTYGSDVPKHDGSITHNSAHTYNSAASTIYNLFDLNHSFDLESGEGFDFASVVATIERFRAAGTHLRAIALNSQPIVDSVAEPSEGATITTTYTTVHNGAYSYNGAVPYAGSGVPTTEALL